MAAFNAADLEGMRSVLADDAVAYVADRDGQYVRIDGAAGYLGAIEAMDLTSAKLLGEADPARRRRSTTTGRWPWSR